MWEVVLVTEVEDWFLALDEESIDTVTAAIDYLEAHGPMAGRPLVDKLKGSKYHHMKELRPSGTSIRVLFLFDPSRQAVLLVAGDKAGQWTRWYRDNIPVAEQRYEAWLEGGA
ncbi:type II toxin-antitoxin system RelE/ParE family toxin [Tsukamurella sp. NPDC003166]|uniref:type II toxin-antitoxin system RelE/ParE family toxin n=1 Tax=Tsukamurella sp. NPDC003166 TaxID=3154444 RepID=UPI0033B21406